MTLGATEIATKIPPLFFEAESLKPLRYIFWWILLYIFEQIILTIPRGQIM